MSGTCRSSRATPTTSRSSRRMSRLREQRVRRAPHQRERLADAHELPARWQHQHRKGPGRASHAAGVRNPRARGEGHHQRLRSRVRPDDGHGSTTRSRRRAPTICTGPRASASAAIRCRRSRSSSPDGAQAGHRGQRRQCAVGGPIVRDKLHFYGAYEYIDRSLITGGQVITVDPTAAQTLGITLPASGVIRPTRRSIPLRQTDYQINAANRLSARYFSSRTRRRRTSAAA